jgi:hypothetical protein
MAVPHTRFSQLAPPQSVPHTMLSSPERVPHTRLSPERMVPQTRLSPFESLTVPQTRLSALNRSAVPHTRFSPSFLSNVPQTRLSPRLSTAAPHMVPSWKAFAFGRIAPPVMRWLPQMTCLLHVFGIGSFEPGWAVRKNFASCTAP